MSYYTFQGQVNAGELHSVRCWALGMADHIGCGLGDTQCRQREGTCSGEVVRFLTQAILCLEHCLLLETPGHLVTPSIRNLFLCDASQNDTAEPKLSTADGNAGLQPAIGICIHPFTLLGCPQKIDPASTWIHFLLLWPPWRERNICHGAPFQNISNNSKTVILCSSLPFSMLNDFNAFNISQILPTF